MGIEPLASPQDEGLSLELLTESYSRVLTEGDDPYEVEESGEEPDQTRHGGPGTGAVPFALELPPDECTDQQDAACPISPTSIVEAILFVGHPKNEPISGRNIASLMRGVRAAEIDLLVQELNRTYADSNCPYRIESTGRGYQLVLLAQFGTLQENFYGRVREAKLSQAAIEALAVIAYGQPISRPEVKQQCNEAQRRAVPQLIRRGLLAMHKGESGQKSDTYETTDRFLTMFNLTNLNDLPLPHDIDRR